MPSPRETFALGQGRYRGVDQMTYLKWVYEAVIAGRAAMVENLVQEALDDGLNADTVLRQGLIPAMEEVGRRMREQEFFIPEVLIAARAMKAGLGPLKSRLGTSGLSPAGRVVLGTVKGDLHDIGKNLVGMMFEGAGFEVIDLGVDVAPEKFVDAVKEQGPDVVALSALLTTTMPAMKRTIDALEAAGLRRRVKVLVGGAPVTRQYADEVGADGYGDDASSAVGRAREQLGLVS